MSNREKQVFLEMFAGGKSRVEVTEALYISESNLNTCLSGIYRKFSFRGKGTGKESRLREYLSQQYKRWKPSNYSNIDETDNTIAVLVQEIREQIKPSIKQRCGTMRVLDMEQPIELTGERGIYTNVNILEKISARRRLDISELLQNCDIENFHRFGINHVSQKSVLGIKAIKRYSKLMVLGKPGAGKTTFLKYLAMQCIEGKLLAKYVPIFVTLKDFAEADGTPDLLTYLYQKIHVDIDIVVIQKIIQKGCAFILLDGLDEVREEDTKRVLRQIRDFSEQFHINQFVITCRIAAKEYTFESFTEIEVADFDKEQITIFAQNWFRVKDDLVKAEKFIKKLEENKPIHELATNPLLLTLLCLVFGEAGNFPANRSELYEEGLGVLLKKWDANRNIERDVVYKNLSVKRKEDLLSQIALTTFENKDYFFKQKIVEEYIGNFIYNIPNARIKPEELELDSEAVLKSIESQHGLLVERAKGIYSFSHLTFQEYFTAREIVETQNSGSLERLIEKITDKRWREVFLLTAEMLRNADELVLLMKRKIDELVANNKKIQHFLEWVNKKSNSFYSSYKKATVRAIYYDSSLLGRSINSGWIIKDTNFPCPNFILSIGHETDIHISCFNMLNIEADIAIDLFLLGILELLENLEFMILSNHYKTKEDTKYILFGDLFHKKQIIAKIGLNLPDKIDYTPWTGEQVQSWWNTSGKAWANQFREAIIEKRNIGHDWQFNPVEMRLLTEYKDNVDMRLLTEYEDDVEMRLLTEYEYSNLLLLKCLNSDCYVSREVRQEIEDTLLLPMSEIKQRKGM
ncbi:MAG: NACHT domain-containing protein [Calothrix sp. MO_167.B12]|nr:NACHT domain-containing protein [Calothrix sp. MO_167.B12]